MVQQPNARRELRLEAGARHERTLEAVSSTPLLGVMSEPVECGALNVRFLRPRPNIGACDPSGACNKHALGDLYSITALASTSRVGGTLSPSALAVFMLMISSMLVSCWTGRSAGLSPLRIRPA
jgi:hypothetical protein